MYLFISDPGHGWLKVPKGELKQLGISEKITPYSYMEELHAYLEEDYDLSLFFEAKGIKKWPSQLIELEGYATGYWPGRHNLEMYSHD